MITAREFALLQPSREELHGLRSRIYRKCRQLHGGITTRKLLKAFPECSRWAVWWHLHELRREGYLRVAEKGKSGRGMGKLLTYEVA